jgi:hypothetical protein
LTKPADDATVVATVLPIVVAGVLVVEVLAAVVVGVLVVGVLVGIVGIVEVGAGFGSPASTGAVAVGIPVVRSKFVGRNGGSVVPGPLSSTTAAHPVATTRARARTPMKSNVGRALIRQR